jgi:hypothetical protein
MLGGLRQIAPRPHPVVVGLVVQVALPEGGGGDVADEEAERPGEGEFPGAASQPVVSLPWVSTVTKSGGSRRPSM